MSGQVKGGILWFTGIPGAGKSTLSQLVGRRLTERGVRIEILDGDVIRSNLSKGLGFSKEDRITNIRRIGFVAKLLAKHKVWVLVAAISPYRDVRDAIRKEVTEQGSGYIEIYVRCPLEVAELRDPKGLYKKARAGEIRAFTGISDPYQEPLSPEVVVQTDKETPEESAAGILSYLSTSGVC
jgi:adenylylsulfate kinase